MIPPVIHLNGTSRDALVEQNHDASIAIMKAREIVRQAQPHGRDFPRGGYEAANREWMAHYEALVRAETHFEDIALALVAGP